MALKSFKEFNKIVDKVFKSNSKNYQQDFTTELGGEIAKLTPVDTGRATANWQGSISVPNLRAVSRTDRTTSANPTKESIKRNVRKSKYKQDLYISNAVKGDRGEGYIIQLENGKSKQAPLGMVLINLARASILSKKALRTIS